MSNVLIPPMDLAKALKSKKIVLIDTRDPESDAVGHIPCAVNAHDVFTYLALNEAGVKDVKMYFGSSNEWSRDPSLTIEEGAPKALAFA